MPKFRVELKEDHAIGRHGEPRNPFAFRDPFAVARRRYRVWQFVANDEADVRRLYNEAKAAGVENVRGFELHSITLVKPAAGQRGETAKEVEP